ncbi:hypothetical protein HELRODRAFT_158762 [Helobdella robusta]|uniref:Zinc finger PHD-type domain-containing protein n=1 Tax=Helobdella robusta TaxID=6412 RepID=T1EN83_HELRO|nr:hypothetical protein HELRODRAFT_158762 [Helobdella robusta]ESO12280.1 hypothetical protein HELRODRAFT_158762 [Helobdella robusta]
MGTRDKCKCKNTTNKDCQQCKLCELIYHELCSGLRCAQCGESFRYKCLSMTSEDYDFIKKCRNLIFKCDNCIDSLPSVEQLVKNFDENNKVLLKEISKLHKMKESMKSEINDFKVKLVAEDNNELRTLEKSRVELCDEMKNFKTELKSSWSEVVSREVKKNIDVINIEVKKNVDVINTEVKCLQETLNESAEQKERENNMMIFRLKESDADKKHVLKILNHLSDGVITDKNVIKLIRIGKRSEHVIRPILLKFDDLRLKDLLFKNIGKMKTIGDDLAQVRLSHDLTREQRNQLKKFLEEAQKKTVDSKGDFLFKVRGDVGKWRVVKIPAGKI